MMKMLPDYPIEETTIEEAATADILCTVTPVRQPIVRSEWIMPGTHINAVGADAAGKQELDPQILKDALVVVDDLKQASSGGEINVPIKKGLYRLGDVYATLGEIISGQKVGRRDDRAITVFDSTGVAIQDLAVAQLVYQRARQEGGYLEVALSDE
jgi:ornithine cyclodeaminase/alanine dehydrogenase-like protein (mu-crystallin family)